MEVLFRRGKAISWEATVIRESENCQYVRIGISMVYAMIYFQQKISQLVCGDLLFNNSQFQGTDIPRISNEDLVFVLNLPHKTSKLNASAEISPTVLNKFQKQNLKAHCFSFEFCGPSVYCKMGYGEGSSL